MKILVTGGTGYIGSHTCAELIAAGHTPVILDNLYNSKRTALKNIAAVAGKEPVFYEGDMRDAALLDDIFARENIEAVIHFAGLKAVGESCARPLEYYGTNVYGTIVLLEAMRRAGVKTLVFSSSATVYGFENSAPFREEMPTGKTTNPYGTTKTFIEQILQDLCVAEPDWRVCLLRYFNPVGAHPSGLLGEDPNGRPNNLMPVVANVARGQQDKLLVFGNDYPTPDGTCIRDYLHVVDLAIGHIKAIEKTLCAPGINIYNLGTGKGQSVLELVREFECASGVQIQCETAPRRPGDIAESYADVTKAARELGWRAEKTPADMCRDLWNFLQKQS